MMNRGVVRAAVKRKRDAAAQSTAQATEKAEEVKDTAQQPGKEGTLKPGAGKKDAKESTANPRKDNISKHESRSKRAQDKEGGTSPKHAKTSWGFGEVLRLKSVPSTSATHFGTHCCPAEDVKMTLQKIADANLFEPERQYLRELSGNALNIEILRLQTMALLANLELSDYTTRLESTDKKHLACGEASQDEDLKKKYEAALNVSKKFEQDAKKYKADYDTEKMSRKTKEMKLNSTVETHKKERLVLKEKGVDEYLQSNAYQEECEDMKKISKPTAVEEFLQSERYNEVIVDAQAGSYEYGVCVGFRQAVEKFRAFHPSIVYYEPDYDSPCGEPDPPTKGQEENGENVQ